MFSIYCLLRLEEAVPCPQHPSAPSLRVVFPVFTERPLGCGSQLGPSSGMRTAQQQAGWGGGGAPVGEMVQTRSSVERVCSRAWQLVNNM